MGLPTSSQMVLAIYISDSSNVQSGWNIFSWMVLMGAWFRAFPHLEVRGSIFFLWINLKIQSSSHEDIIFFHPHPVP